MNGIAIERHNQLLFFERLQDGGPVNRHEEVHATWCKLARRSKIHRNSA
jgi:hypothetical protein